MLEPATATLYCLQHCSKSPVVMSEAVQRILIVGAGGREHALAWKLSQSPLVERIFIAPGNGGTDLSPRCENVAIASTDFDALREFAIKNEVRTLGKRLLNLGSSHACYRSLSLSLDLSSLW